MNAKSIARLLVVVVALAVALGILTTRVPFVLGIGIVLVVNAAVVTWLKWHDEQQPAHTARGR